MKKVFIGVVFCFLLLACAKINVFEKNIAIKDHTWQRNNKPVIAFNIDDTASLYNLYIVLRHSDAYDFNNIWIKCSVVSPGDSASKSRDYNLPLAKNNQGWSGTGMDDIYEHRVLIQPRTKFNKPGEYRFILEQIMREDPLEHVLNVGMRVERVK
ncbi:MAG: gliding motility lipoprotein GldH [Chitinophagaceae bacterium]